MTLMSPSEALVETLKQEGVTVVSGIVGSAFMDMLDLFPEAGIRFVPVRHEQSAGHMADAYARVLGIPGVCIGQNGPGVTNFVTSVAAAYLAHSPVLAITPSVTSSSVGLDGFQETNQMDIFRAITKFQAQVNRPDRIAELARTCFRVALAERGPAQLDIPRDYFYGEIDVEILPPERYRVSGRGAGDRASLDQAAALLKQAKHPVILSGMGVVEAGAIDEVKALAEYLTAPVATSYLHNDAFPKSHPLSVGPIGYQGSKAAMRLIQQADVILALGTRLSAFGTLPQYGIDYFPKNADIIQVDIDYRQLGRVKPIRVGIVGDAKEAGQEILARLQHEPRKADEAQKAEIASAKAAWAEELTKLSSKEGTPISPKRALRELTSALPQDVIVTTDIGNICSVSNAFLNFEEPRHFLAALSFGNCGFSYPAAMGAQLARPKAPVLAIVGDGAWGMSLHEVMTAVEQDLPVVAAVFNNGQWGAEKKNQVDYYSNRFVGTNIKTPNFAEVARAMGADGVRVEHPKDVAGAIRTAFQSRRPTVVEIMVDPTELAEPFRRDALKVPVRHLPKYQVGAGV